MDITLHGLQTLSVSQQHDEVAVVMIVDLQLKIIRVFDTVLKDRSSKYISYPEWLLTDVV